MVCHTNDNGNCCNPWTCAYVELECGPAVPPGDNCGHLLNCGDCGENGNCDEDAGVCDCDDGYDQAVFGGDCVPL